jgi:hypothetical protein
LPDDPNIASELGASVHEIARKVPAKDAAVAVIILVVVFVLGYVATTVTSIFSANPYLVTAILLLILVIIGGIAIYSLRIWDKARSTEPKSDWQSRQDFRNAIAAELHTILKKFVDPLNNLDIDYPSWSSKAEQSRIAVLGRQDCASLDAVYLAVEERNRYLTSRHGFSLAELDPLNQKCVQALSETLTKMRWLRESIPDSDSLLTKVKSSVGLR